jgi:hypothetical protein
MNEKHTSEFYIALTSNHEMLQPQPSGKERLGKEQDNKKRGATRVVSPSQVPRQGQNFSIIVSLILPINTIMKDIGHLASERHEPAR